MMGKERHNNADAMSAIHETVSDLNKSGVIDDQTKAHFDRDYRASLLKRLRDPDYAAGYLSDVLSEESEEAFLIALKDVIDARQENPSILSERLCITHRTLSEVLSGTKSPRLSTWNQVLGSLGFQLSVAKKDVA
jgi:DNA-binding phage protein